MQSSSASSRSKRKKVGGDLPFADPADVLEVHENNDVSNWASGPLAAAIAKQREIKRPKPVLVPQPQREPVTPPPLRRRFRYYINRPFNAEVAVSVAPAARSSKRFTERSEIRYGENPTWDRWPEVILTAAGVALGIWVLLSI